MHICICSFLASTHDFARMCLCTLPPGYCDSNNIFAHTYTRIRTHTAHTANTLAHFTRAHHRTHTTLRTNNSDCPKAHKHAHTPLFPLPLGTTPVRRATVQQFKSWWAPAHHTGMDDICICIHNAYVEMELFGVARGSVRFGGGGYASTQNGASALIATHKTHTHTAEPRCGCSLYAAAACCCSTDRNGMKHSTHGGFAQCSRLVGRARGAVPLFCICLCRI